MNEKAIYVQQIDKYLEGNKEDFYPLFILGSKKTILECLEKYVRKYPERSIEISLIVKNIDELYEQEMTKENFLKMLDLKRNTQLSNYYDLIYRVLTVSEEEAIDMLYRTNVDYTKCSRALNSLKKYHKNQVKEIVRVERIFKKYKDKGHLVTSDKTKYINVNLTDEETFNLSDDLKEVYTKNYSIEEYCSMTGKKINTLKRECEKLSNGHNIKSQMLATQILLRDNTKFYEYLTNIVYEMLVIDSLDIIDYYERTRLIPNDLRDILTTIGIKDRNVTDLIVKIKRLENATHKVSKIDELRARTVISGTEIEKEDKEKIFNYLDNNNIPYNACYTAYKRFVEGRLELSKTLVKRG